MIVIQAPFGLGAIKPAENIFQIILRFSADVTAVIFRNLVFSFKFIKHGHVSLIAVIAIIADSGRFSFKNNAAFRTDLSLISHQPS
jgi:hypothetical protein